MHSKLLEAMVRAVQQWAVEVLHPMHEDILKDPLIVRCLGKLEEFTLYEARTGYNPDGKGVTVFGPPPTQEQKWWDMCTHELRTRKDRVDLPRNIFLETFQAEAILRWAGDRIVPMNEDNLLPCADCKGSGWYVGMVERYYCPTCNGAGKIEG